MRYLLLAPMLFLMSCSMFKSGADKSSHKTMAVASLSGTQWALDSIIYFAPEKELMRPVTLIFSDTSNDVYGSGGCNHFNGHFAQSKNELHFSHLLSTKMYCNVGSKTETRFTSVLLRCNRATMDSGGHLILMEGDKTLAIFEKYNAKAE